MEKFGIFELLDALSALSAENAPSEKSTAETGDKAFDPPVYGGDEPHKASGKESDALSGFLARHDAMARKAEKK